MLFGLSYSIDLTDLFIKYIGYNKTRIFDCEFACTNIIDCKINTIIICGFENVNSKRLELKNTTTVKNIVKKGLT